jgi:hypothetical protein
MTQRIPDQRGRLISEQKGRWWALGAMRMKELTKSLTDAEREALAQALALLLERPDLAGCGSEGLDR